MVNNNILLFIVINDCDNACARDYSMGPPSCEQLPKIIVALFMPSNGHREELETPATKLNSKRLQPTNL